LLLALAAFRGFLLRFGLTVWIAAHTRPLDAAFELHPQRLPLAAWAEFKHQYFGGSLRGHVRGHLRHWRF